MVVQSVCSVMIQGDDRMEMDFAKQSIESFVQDLNSAKPMPGGGSAAAVCGAMGAALAGMSAHMTVGKKKFAAVEGKMQQIITVTETLQQELLDLSREDAEMYLLVLQAFKLPSTTEEEKQQRQDAIEEASKAAVVSSLKVVSACEKILQLAYVTVTEGSKLLVTDGAAAAILARACQRVASYNVHINLQGIRDPKLFANTCLMLDRQLEKCRELEEKVLKEVEERL